MTSSRPADDPLVLAVAMDCLPGVVVPCAVCGGRGAWPTTQREAWVPWTGCGHCAGTGEQPPGPGRDIMADEMTKQQPL